MNQYEELFAELTAPPFCTIGISSRPTNARNPDPVRAFHAYPSRNLNHLWVYGKMFCYQIGCLRPYAKLESLCGS